MVRNTGIYRWLTAAGMAGMLSACGGGGTPAPESEPPVARASPDFLLDYMQDWYLWYEALPAQIDPKRYADADAALADLRVPMDRFSYIETAQTYNAFFDDGRALGFGLSYQVDANAARVRMVQPLAPAYAAGLRRGDRIVSIEQVPTADLIASDRLADAFGPSEVGLIRQLGVLRDGQQLTLSIRKDWYPLSYVLAKASFQVHDRRVGYVNFYSFASLGVSAWQDALDELLAAGAQDLIVDLRENGGGLLASAAAIGSALGRGDLSGQVMASLAFNRRHTAANRDFRFSTDPRDGRFDRLVWITGARTCSASEALIAGLLPWRPAVRIGQASCGKPVGFTPPTHEGFVYSIVSFASRNATGFGDYFDGLQPDCNLVDPVIGEFGDPNETLLAGALTWLRTGSCPPASASGAQAKRVQPGQAQTELRGLSGLTGLH